MKICKKKKFTQSQAERAVNNALWQREGGNFNRLECRPYYCKLCNAYHLTKQIKRERKTYKLTIKSVEKNLQN